MSDIKPIDFRSPASAANWQAKTGLSEAWMAANLMEELPPGFTVQIDAANSVASLSAFSRQNDGFVEFDSRILLDSGVVRIDHLMTDGELSGKGIAGKIVNTVVNLAGNAGLDRITVEAACENGGSFWLRHAFFIETQGASAAIAEGAFRRLFGAASSIPGHLYNQAKDMLTAGSHDNLCHLARIKEKTTDGIPLHDLLFGDVVAHCYFDLKNPAQNDLFVNASNTRGLSPA